MSGTKGDARGARARRAPGWAGVVGLVALALILLAAFPYFEQVRNANEIPRLVQAMALVEHGEWAIDGPSRRGLALGPDIARSPVDGRAYPNKPPGASVVGAAAYGIARLGDQPPTLRELTWWARLLAGVVPVVVFAGLAWRRLDGHYGPAIASAAVASAVLATPLFSYARLFYGHALAACLLYVGVVTIEAALREGRRVALALGAIAAAGAITVEYGAAFAGLPIAALFGVGLVRARTSEARREAGVAAGVGLAAALVPVALLAIYQARVFGSPWSTGYHHAADPSFAALHGQGLLGLGMPRWANVETHWLSPRTGLLVWSPLVVLGLVGLARASLRPGPLQTAARVQLGVFATLALMGLGLSFEGGWRIGPRYLVVALPMLALGLAELLAWLRAQLEAREGRLPGQVAASVWVVAGLVSWSLVTNALAATMWPHVDPTHIGEPFGEVLIPLWRSGHAPYGLPTAFGGATTLSLALPIAAGLAALVWVLAVGRRWQARALILALVLVGAGLGILAPTRLIPGAVEPAPKSERNLRYIERVYEPRRDARTGEWIAGPSKRLDSTQPPGG